MAWKGYDDWRKKLKNSGYYMSDDDLERAAGSESFANQIFSAKEAYANATTDAEKAAAHQMAEDARNPYQYSGGGDGSEYLPWDNVVKRTSSAPRSARPTYTRKETKAERPAYEPRYQDYIDDVLADVRGYGDYVSPYADRINTALSGIEDYGPYVSPYADRIDAQLNGILNRDPFSYDYTTDPAWQAYRKEYTREGRRASEDTLGQMAAMTGGMPSTAAMTAAQQAGDYYSAQMADKIPELYRLAYSMYADEGDRMLNNLSALRGLDSDEYGRYSDAFNRRLSELSALEGLDATEYGRFVDRYNRLLQNMDAARSLENDAYGRYRDTVGDWETDRNFDYNAYLNDLSQWNTDRAYEDSRADTEYERQLNEALVAAQYGDNSGLEALGINPDLNNVLSFALASSGRTTPVGSGGGGGSGNPTPKSETPQFGDEITYADPYGKQIVKETVGDPQAAYNYLVTMWDAMNGQMRFELFKNMGYDSNTAIYLRDHDFNTFQNYVGTFNGGNNDQDNRSTYEKMYDAGITDPNTSYQDSIEWLLRNGYKSSDAETLAMNYDPSRYAGSGDGAIGTPVDMSSVAALGLGDVTAQELSDLVAAGKVKKYLSGGKWKFQWVGQPR